MATKKILSFKFVACIKNEKYPASLELYKIYRVLPDADAIERGDIRVIDESGEDYLYPSDYFIPIEVPYDLEQAIIQTSY